MYDILIIGGGVTGAAIARELSRYDLKTALLEKGEDVCSGTSKANSGIAHAGFDAVPGSLKSFPGSWIFPIRETVLWCSALTRRTAPVWKSSCSREKKTA